MSLMKQLQPYCKHMRDMTKWLRSTLRLESSNYWRRKQRDFLLIFNRDLIVLPAPEETEYENNLKEDLINLIDEMKELHFQVIKADITVSAKTSKTIQDETIKIESLLSSGVKIDTSSLVDAIFTVLIYYHKN